MYICKYMCIYIYACVCAYMYVCGYVRVCVRECNGVYTAKVSNVVDVYESRDCLQWP